MWTSLGNKFPIIENIQLNSMYLKKINRESQTNYSVLHLNNNSFFFVFYFILFLNFDKQSEA